MVTGDFDKDGNVDVAVLDATTGYVEVQFGDGSGGFRSPVVNFTITTSNSQYRGIAVGDLDGDGKAELVFAAGNSVQVYDWQNNGSFTKTHTIDLTASTIVATKVAVGDLTAAGSQDIVVGDNFGDVGIVWIPNDGMGTFGTPVAYAASGVSTYSRIVAMDVDGDGLADVAFVNSKIPQATASVLLNKGDGTLVAEASYGTTALAGFRPNAIAVADVDGDHFPDLVVTGYVHDAATLNNTFYLSVNLNNGGNGTFGDGKAFGFTANGGKNISANVVEAADLNGDGLAEIITPVEVPGTISVNGFDGFIVTRWTGAGANLAIEGQDNVLSDFISYGSVAVGDLNGDTQNDVLIGTSSTIFGSTQHSQFALFLNSTPTLPTGRKVEFAQTTLSVTEGEALDVSVVRGSDSTGQVVVYFTVGGSAVQAGSKVKNSDYSITDPPQQSQAVVFAAGEYQKNIHIVASAAKSSESAQTIVLTLQNPIGDAEPIDAANLPPKATAIVTI